MATTLGLGLGLQLTNSPVASGGPAPSITLSGQVSPATTWTVTDLATLTAVNGPSGYTLEVSGLPAGLVIVPEA